MTPPTQQAAMRQPGAPNERIAHLQRMARAAAQARQRAAEGYTTSDYRRELVRMRRARRGKVIMAVVIMIALVVLALVCLRTAGVTLPF